MAGIWKRCFQNGVVDLAKFGHVYILSRGVWRNFDFITVSHYICSSCSLIDSCEISLRKVDAVKSTILMENALHVSVRILSVTA